MNEQVYSPQSLVDEIDARRRTITVFVPPDETDATTDLEDHFATRNVTVETRTIPVGREGFVVVRSEGLPQRTVPLGAVRALLSGNAGSEWRTLPTDVDTPSAVVGLDELCFRSFDRRQMLFTCREIEERAYRIGHGTLHVGFQREGAFEAQREVYEALLTRGVTVDAYMGSLGSEAVGRLEHPNLSYHVDPVPELSNYWFLAYDGGGEPYQKCALVAEERARGRYYGVWTYDPSLVAGLVAYLKATY
ncbi:DICT sensory domain-containing protein [Halomarina litorea]|uniref:DICT sensory domain-containing protein n=1 Tax=Halomarina litorea TaxID=2961595 RepID=UPI0020C3DF8E|nr:DICT sensory domain-containing protein [Halomarina sp. BCD28]